MSVCSPSLQYNSEFDCRMLVWLSFFFLNTRRNGSVYVFLPFCSLKWILTHRYVVFCSHGSGLDVHICPSFCCPEFDLGTDYVSSLLQIRIRQDDLILVSLSAPESAHSSTLRCFVISKARTVCSMPVCHSVLQSSTWVRIICLLSFFSSNATIAKSMSACSSSLCMKARTGDIYLISVSKLCPKRYMCTLLFFCAWAL